MRKGGLCGDFQQTVQRCPPPAALRCSSGYAFGAKFAGGRLNPQCVVVIAPIIGPNRRPRLTRPLVGSTDCGNRHALPESALVAPGNHARGQCQRNREIKQAMEADTAQNPTANDGRTRPARSYADGQDGRHCRTPWQVNQLLTEKTAGCVVYRGHRHRHHIRMPATGSSGMVPTTTRPPAETTLARLSVPADPKRATRAGTASAATAAGSGQIPSLLQSAPAWTQVWYRRQPASSASSKPRSSSAASTGSAKWRSNAARWEAKPLEVHPLATSPNAAQDCPKYYGLQDILLGREAETLKLALCIGRYLTA